MNIGSGLNAISRFTVDKATAVYTFSKDAIMKGCSKCSSLAVRVTQIATRAIPNAVSNTVKANPKSFSCALGVIIGGSIIGAIFYRALSIHKKTATDQAAKMHQDGVALLNSIKAFVEANDSANALDLLDSELLKHAP